LDFAGLLPPVMEHSIMDLSAPTAAAAGKKGLFVALGVGIGEEVQWTFLPVSSSIKGLAQVQDCTCLLDSDGTVTPKVFFKKEHSTLSRIGLGGASLKSVFGDESIKAADDTILSIQACGSMLLGIGQNKLHLWEYVKHGTFKSPISFPMDVVHDGVALWPKAVVGFGKELAEDAYAPLRKVSLDVNGLTASTADQATGKVMANLFLHKKRKFVKIASGNDSALILAFAKATKNAEWTGKLYIESDGKLVKVCCVSLLVNTCLIASNVCLYSIRRPHDSTTA
jgi:hypothetical protein